MNEKKYIEIYNAKTEPEERVLEYRLCSRAACDGYDFCFECGGAGGYSVPVSNRNVIQRNYLSDDQLRVTKETIEKLNSKSELFTENENILLLKHYTKLLNSTRTKESKLLLKKIVRIRNNEIRLVAVDKTISFLTKTFKIIIDLETYDDIYINSNYSEILIPNHRNYYWSKPEFAKINVTKNKVVVFSFGIFYQFIRTLSENSILCFKNRFTISKVHYPIQELNSNLFVSFTIIGKRDLYYFVLSERRIKYLLRLFINKLGTDGVTGWYYE